MKKTGYLLLFLVLILVSCNKQKTVSLLYFTDAHEIMPVPFQKKDKGGIARLKYLTDSIRNERPTTVIFGGDLAGGTLFGKVYKGAPMIEAFNQLPVTIANFGQHEFDYGLENIKNLVKKSSFQWISSNITHQHKEPFLQLPTYWTQNIDGINIGFIGITDKVNTSSQNADIIQDDITVSAQKAVKELRSKNVDYLIAITQMGIAKNEKLLADVPEINLIFTEEISEETSLIQHFDNKYIIAPLGNIGSVAEVKLTKVKQKIIPSVQIHFLDSHIPKDNIFDQLAQKYQDSLENQLSKIIGKSTAIVQRGAHLQRESAMGNLITDAFRNYYKTDIAMINGGGIRSSFGSTSITRKDVFAVMPFDNRIEVIKITGKQLIELLQKGLLNYKSLGGEFLQVSGLTYSFAISPNGKATFKNATIKGKPLMSDNIYTVALPNYVCNGGGEFDRIANEFRITPPHKRVLDVTILEQYLQSKPIITPILEQRINIISAK